jgi:predicted anti-sigma-YlaC factor YlaD
MIMTTDPFTDRLSEYLDGELSAPERAAVDAHLLECGACRSTLDELRAVVAEAAQLTNAPPARELWSGIAARITPGGRPRARVSPFRRAITSRLSFTLPQLAAASIALMVLSGGLVWMARSGDPRVDFEPINAQTGPVAPMIAPANFADPHYDEAIADLERTHEAGRTKLDPETVRVLEENLRSIDRAIDQCRRALATDPANVYLSTHLADTRQRKLALLRRATTLAMRGN